MNDDDTEIAPSMRVATLIRAAMDALSVRVQKWAAMVLGFALFAAVVWRPGWATLAGACAFSVLSLLLIGKERRA